VFENNALTDGSLLPSSGLSVLGISCWVNEVLINLLKINKFNISLIAWNDVDLTLSTIYPS